MGKFFKKYTVVFLLILSFAVSGYKSWQETIFFTDELLIEDAAFTMAAGGSWIIPNVNGSAYLAKPPLLYWLYAPLYLYLAPTAFIRRIWMIIFGVLLTLTLFRLVERWYGRQTAVYTALFFTLSFPFVYFTKAANWDLANAFFITLTLYFYNHKRRSVRYFLTFISLGLAVLNRSFLALIPAVVIGVNEIFGNKRYQNRKLFFASILLFLLIILPWHIAAVRANYEEFLRQYFQLPFLFHLLSLVPGDTLSSPLFYLVIFILFPPVFFILAYLGQLLLTKKISLKIFTEPKHIQLTVWIIGYAAILIISRTRHEWYLIPLFPALSTACGYSLVRLISREKKSRNYYLYSLMAIIFLLSPLYALFIQPMPEAEIIQAVKTIQKEKNSFTLPGKNPIFYIYKYDMVPVTRLYPKKMRGIIVDNLKFLEENQGRVDIIIKKEDLEELPDKNNKQIRFQGEVYSIVSYN